MIGADPGPGNGPLGHVQRIYGCELKIALTMARCSKNFLRKDTDALGARLQGDSYGTNQ